MPTQQPGWEGPLLAFGGIFTVLLGLSYGASIYFRTPIPWFAIVIVSLAATFGLAYLRRRQRS
jgi:hypothetical protein